MPCDFAGEPGCPSALQDFDIPVQFALIDRETLTSGSTPFGTRGVIPAIDNEVLGVYVQDDYRFTNNGTVNVGLRWNYDHDFIGKNQVNQARRGRRTTRKKNLQPRLGIAWLLGKILIRGGYGTYFQQNLLETRQLELLADGVRLPLERSFGGTLSNPFGGLGPATPPDIFVTSNELRERLTHTFGVSTQIELKSFVLSADLVVRRSRNFPIRVEINRREDGTRLNSQFGSVLEAQSASKASNDALSISLRRRYGNGFAMIRNITWMHRILCLEHQNQAKSYWRILPVPALLSTRGLTGSASFGPRHGSCFRAFQITWKRKLRAEDDRILKPSLRDNSES